MRDVADTMFMCKLWFEGNGVRFTGDTLIAMAKMERESSDIQSGDRGAKS